MTGSSDVLIHRHASGISLDYDEGANVLYLSVGEPRPAVGIDIGDGLVLRYDEERHEVAGLTVIGLRQRLLSALDGASRRPTAGESTSVTE